MKIVKNYPTSDGPPPSIDFLKGWPVPINIKRFKTSYYLLALCGNAHLEIKRNAQFPIIDLRISIFSYLNYGKPGCETRYEEKNFLLYNYLGFCYRVTFAYDTH